MAKLVLKSERGRYRFYLNDDAGEAVFTGSFIAEKDKALMYCGVVQSDSFESHLQHERGPDGRWILKGFVRQTREGEKGDISDAIPLGFSKVFATEAELDGALAEIIKVAKAAEFVDES